MKLTKKLEAEILNVYNAYWYHYLEGDVEAMHPLLDDEYTQVGSAEGEVFYNKKDAVQFLHETIDQVAGKLDMRHRKTTLEHIENAILIHEFCDLYAFADNNWIFYSKFRASTLMKEKKDGWKIIHQHSSFPDTRTDEGQNIAIDKIAEENLQLRDAIRRRTIELEHKTRELEIEASLERVRTATMAMQDSNEIGALIYKFYGELTKLDAKLDRAFIMIVNPENKGITWWLAGKEGLLAENGFFIQKNQHPSHLMYLEKWEKRTKKWQYLFEGKEKRDWDRFGFSKTELSRLPEFIKKDMAEVKSVHLSGSSDQFGLLVTGSLEPLPEEQQDIIYRFTTAFNQAFIRFLDLQKAEAQAREAHIQLGLERVRAKAMAMQHSNELAELVDTVFKELTRLHFLMNRCQIIIIDPDRSSMRNWMANPEIDQTPNSYLLTLNDHPYFLALRKAWKEKQSKWLYNLKGDEKNALVNYVFTHTEFSKLPDMVKQGMKKTSNIYFNASFNNFGSLQVDTLEPLSEENLDILSRFSRVFDLTYTRFNDLKQAEAQAREAQIEAALERVRAKTMAMHNSEDVSTAIATLFTELDRQSIENVRCGIAIIDINKTMEVWSVTNVEGARPDERLGRGKMVKAAGKFDMNAHKLWQLIYNDWKNKSEFLYYHLSGKEKQKYIDLLSTAPGYLSQPLLELPDMHCQIYFFNEGAIWAYSLQPHTDLQQLVMNRFTSVFSQTYLRYRDLQKAEAQAREAQIEVALERVRARAMAMHTSSELESVAFELRTQMGLLKSKELETCAINLYEEAEDEVLAWGAMRPPENQNEIVGFNFSFPKKGIALIDEMLKTYLSGAEDCLLLLEGEKMTQWLKVLAKARPDIFAIVDEAVHYTETGYHKAWYSCAFFPGGTLIMITFSEPDIESRKLLSKFSQVFGLAYRRFSDLKKAEAQAREAKIEAALERVRSRSMGMQKSEELKDVIKVVYEQLVHLNIKLDHAGFVVDYQPKADWHFWIADKQEIPSKITHPYFESVWATQFNNAKAKGEELFVTYLNFEEKNKFYNELLSYVSGLPQASKDFYLNCPAFAASTVLLDNLGLYIENFEGIPYSDDENIILMRFGKVFQQTYTRFLDLQKAEAQAREAQIEAALERVRSRSLAMHRSEELEEVILVVSEQLRQLQFRFHNVSFGFDTDQRGLNFWLASSDLPKPLLIKVPYIDNPAFNQPLDARNKGFDFSTDILTQVENHQFLRHMFENSELRHIPAESKNFLMSTLGFARSQCLMKNTILTIGNYVPVPYNEEQNAVIRRFGKVFEQAYTRFLDLQKAEAQAREAQIEAALERVRSKTMAMHNSQDVGDSVATLFDELVKLDVKTNRCGILIHNDTQFAEVWTAKSNANEKAALIIGNLEINMHPMLVGARASWANKETFFSYELKDQDMINYYQTINNSKYYPTQFNLEALPAKETHSDFHFSDGSLFAFTNEALPAESAAIFKRFTSVFGQTYRRYLDLQKAEAQAREATIEASLEKVRGKAMAMHTSNDLLSTAGVVFTELKRMGINSFRGGVALIDKESRLAKMYSATSSEEGATLSLSGTIILDGHPILSKIWDYMDSQSDYFPLLKGELLESYITHVSAAFNSPLIKSLYDEWYGCFLPYSEGAFYVWSDKPYTDDEIKVLKRFRAIVDLTFRRYLELQRAEANALDALRSASLDRVRAEIASMRTRQDLERITPLIWKELTTLGIPFVRCGVFIMDEQEELIHTYLSTPDGKAIAAFHLPYNSNPFYNTIEEWRAKKIHVTHWDKEEFSALADSLVKEGQIANREQYLISVPKGGLHLHYIPFLQGIVYVGNTTPLTDDNLQLVQSVADAFSTAYARYEDFNKIEFAKAQVEKTLADLKQTQAQLVQSEKMASLGELTAGIAHEIQNPLNFVNNFSEVSAELIDEMNEEIDNGNFDDAKEIAKDLQQNLIKINHHGKRAGDIVKGMLQHSRTSSGKKELTDINALTDEYLRLAYHGLKAKDKSFNATMETEFDPGLPKLEVIQQDIGRVILNLITNAFYAVNERNKIGGTGYKATVWVKTKFIDDKVEMIVKDNGNGIPGHIIDKIFQPFFTTKPTGVGTGLGLSLAYDIVKSHGGELKVETKEGEGSEFIIQLPI